MQITSFFISKVISPRSIWHWCKNWSHDWSDAIFFFFFTGRLASQNNRCYLLEEMLLELIQKYLNVLVYWNRNGDPLPFWSLLDSAWGSRLSILALNVPVSICMHLFISKLLFFSMSANPHKLIIRENYCLESRAAYCGNLSCCLCWLCIIKVILSRFFFFFIRKLA